MRKRSRRKTRLHIITSCDSSVWRQQQISQHHSHHITPQSTEALHEVCTPLYVIHTCIDLSSGAVMHTHTPAFTHRWQGRYSVLLCPAIHRWQIFYLAAAASGSSS